MVADLVGDFVAALHGQGAVHLDVNFHEEAEAALAGATFLDAHDARDGGGELTDLGLERVGWGRRP